MITKILRTLLPLACAACLASVSVTAEAAHAKSHKAKTTAKAPATKAAGKSRSTSTPSKKPAGKKTSAERKKQVQTCKTVRVKTAKGVRSQRRCTSAPVENALQSPIGAGDINGAAGSAGSSKQELKARTIPDRAYAVDGYTFFHQGRKYRVLGIDEHLVPAGSDLAKQRLQVALDSGPISVEPETVDENGTMRAVVRIGAKNLADVLNSRN